MKTRMNRFERRAATLRVHVHAAKHWCTYVCDCRRRAKRQAAKRMGCGQGQGSWSAGQAAREKSKGW